MKVPTKPHCHTLDPMNLRASSPPWVRMFPASGRLEIVSEGIFLERRAARVRTASGTPQLTMGNSARSTAQTEL